MSEYETAENASKARAYAEPKAPQRTNRYQYLTDTNPDTRAGKLLRQYWQPVALTADLPPGGPPLGIRIMGQDVVLFRDDTDHVGALDRKCIHRCADLVLGRIENGWIRGPYYGWLYDTNGRVLDQPAEVSPTAKRRLRARLPDPQSRGRILDLSGRGTTAIVPRVSGATGLGRISLHLQMVRRLQLAPGERR